MFKLRLLPKGKRILRYLLQANDEIRPLYSNLSYETQWKTPTTLCKSPWQVCWLLIIFSASGFPVIIEFQPATCTLQPANHTCRFWQQRKRMSWANTLLPKKSAWNKKIVSKGTLKYKAKLNLHFSWSFLSNLGSDVLYLFSSRRARSYHNSD